MSESLQTRDGRSVLRMERWLGHAPEKVWRAVTEPGRLADWFPEKITPELRVGGAVAYESGENGAVTDLDPPRLIAYTWGADHLRWELEPGGILKPFARSFMAVFQRTFQRDVDNLKSMMESGAL